VAAKTAARAEPPGAAVKIKPARVESDKAREQCRVVPQPGIIDLVAIEEAAAAARMRVRVDVQVQPTTLATASGRVSMQLARHLEARVAAGEVPHASRCCCIAVAL
jgi:hypothetical protein